MGEHTISAEIVQRTVEGAVDRGVDVESLLRRCAIAPEVLREPSRRVPRASHVAPLRRLTHAYGDEMLGLGSWTVPPGAFFTACHLAVTATNLQDALHLVFSHYRKRLRDFSPRLVVEGELAVASLGRTGNGRGLQFAQASFCFFAIQVMWWLVGKRVPLERVEFTHDETLNSV